MHTRVAPWIGGFAEWTDENTAFLSVAFTWLLDKAYERAVWWKALGYRVRAGGPALFTRKHHLADVAECGGDYPDAVTHHNPMATFASRGCPVNCWFCIVPAMEGRSFTLIDDFPVRPILCDNNLSGLPVAFQQHIVARYQKHGVKLLDAQSGFDPKDFDEDCLQRWRVINRGPWRFAFDEQNERHHVERVMLMLRKAGINRRRIRVYVLIGNEPVASCLDRINSVIAWGGEPHAQPYIKLNALVKRPHIRFDWTESLLRDVARWANHWPWHERSWVEYRPNAHTRRERERYDVRQEMLL